MKMKFEKEKNVVEFGHLQIWQKKIIIKIKSINQLMINKMNKEDLLQFHHHHHVHLQHHHKVSLLYLFI